MQRFQPHQNKDNQQLMNRKNGIPLTKKPIQWQTRSVNITKPTTHSDCCKILQNGKYIFGNETKMGKIRKLQTCRSSTEVPVQHQVEYKHGTRCSKTSTRIIKLSKQQRTAKTVLNVNDLLKGNFTNNCICDKPKAWEMKPDIKTTNTSMAQNTKKRKRKHNNSSKNKITDHDYIEFLLKITEDIIEKGFYTNTEMNRIFNSHIEANIGRLDKEGMKKQIINLCRELQLPFYKTYQTYENPFIAESITNRGCACKSFPNMAIKINDSNRKYKEVVVAEPVHKRIVPYKPFKAALEILNKYKDTIQLDNDVKTIYLINSQEHILHSSTSIINEGFITKPKLSENLSNAQIMKFNDVPKSSQSEFQQRTEATSIKNKPYYLGEQPYSLTAPLVNEIKTKLIKCNKSRRISSLDVLEVIENANITIQGPHNKEIECVLPPGPILIPKRRPKEIYTTQNYSSNESMSIALHQLPTSFSIAESSYLKSLGQNNNLLAKKDMCDRNIYPKSDLYSRIMLNVPINSCSKFINSSCYKVIPEYSEKCHSNLLLTKKYEVKSASQTISEFYPSCATQTLSSDLLLDSTFLLNNQTNLSAQDVMNKIDDIENSSVPNKMQDVCDIITTEGKSSLIASKIAEPDESQEIVPEEVKMSNSNKHKCASPLLDLIPLSMPNNLSNLSVDLPYKSFKEKLPSMISTTEYQKHSNDVIPEILVQQEMNEIASENEENSVTPPAEELNNSWEKLLQLNRVPIIENSDSLTLNAENIKRDLENFRNTEVPISEYMLNKYNFSVHDMKPVDHSIFISADSDSDDEVTSKETPIMSKADSVITHNQSEETTDVDYICCGLIRKKQRKRRDEIDVAVNRSNVSTNYNISAVPLYQLEKEKIKLDLVFQDQSSKEKKSKISFSGTSPKVSILNATESNESNPQRQTHFN